jgi:primosomal protein N' (replication factor Y) (superfamily II helicase)
MIIEVVLKNKIKSSDQWWYYSPHAIPVGCRVKVMLNNQTLVGLIIDCMEDRPTSFELKPVLEVLDDTPVLSPLFLRLFEYAQTICLDTKYEILQQVLPIDRKLNDKSLTPTIEKKYIRTHRLLTDSKLKKLDNLVDLKPGDFIDLSTFTTTRLKAFVKDGLCDVVEDLPSFIVRNNAMQPPLNQEQKEVVDAIDLQHHEVHVIKGPTGSGKTHVFMACAQKVLNQSKRVLIGVPEISLTPQMVQRFQAFFSVPVIVYHSYLSPKEKVTALAQIRKHEACIVIATRSGLFIDESFGLIILDEEHDSSFYQSTPMVYHAHDIALFIAQECNIPLLLASATLSLETYAKALKGIYRLHELKTRHEANLPTLHIVNMREDIKKNESYMISKPLKEAIDLRLTQNEQVLILMNRRGAFPTLTCKSCMQDARCPECGLNLNYHSDTQKIHCHYCAKVYTNYACVHCGHAHFSGSGYGTQSVVSRLQTLFPQARIARLDSDVDTVVQSSQILDDFALGKMDILVGTSLIAKGLDIESVTCVGILEADQALSFLNLRSSESTFAMLMQAAGRSGRAKKHGEVFVQVMDPHHRVIECLRNHDYTRFFKEEMAFRHQAQLPPYVYLIAIEFAHEAANIAFEGSLSITKTLQESMHTIGPSMLLKQRGKYRYQTIIKSKDWIKTLQQLKELKITQNSKIEVRVIANPYALGGV